MAMPVFIPTALLIISFAFPTTRAADHFSIIDYDRKHVPSRRSGEQVKGLLELWQARHGKVCNGNGEKDRRFEAFKDNLQFIDEHNWGNRRYKMGLNQFADLTNEEFKSMYLGNRTDAMSRFVKSRNASRRYAVPAGEEFPESVNWREKGAVAAIKN